jgi:hypothetical protein
MSADLFAEFGAASAPQQSSSGSGNLQPQLASTFSFLDEPTSTAPAQATRQPPQPPAFQWSDSKRPTQDENDDWGDFEGSASIEPGPAKPDPFAFISNPPITQPSRTSWQSAPVFQAKKSYDSNVLFDAEDADAGDDDDFGDFEGPVSDSPPPQPPTSSGIEDLLGDLTVSQAKPSVDSQKPYRTTAKHAHKSSTTKSNPANRLGTAPPAKQLLKSSPSPIAKQEDSWDSFDDWEASIPTKPPPQTITTSQPLPNPSSSASQSGITSPNPSELQPGELPPTNVPPPGVLLSLFPPLFAEAQEKLFKPMIAETLPMRNKVLAEPATIKYLQGYLELASVAARVIAGRKLRWKRDTNLSQGMRIGPASSRATSGMKLTGIDKSENMKEEREVSDVVRAWKEQVGRLRHVVSAANQIKAGALGRGPDLQEAIPVRTLKQAEGGIPARLPCMLCGLKRDERVAMVDQAVEDSFGEWWVDQVNMHRGTSMKRPVNRLASFCCLYTSHRLTHIPQRAEIFGRNTRTSCDNVDTPCSIIACGVSGAGQVKMTE